MEAQRFIDSLEQFATVMPALIVGLTESDLLFRPMEDEGRPTWSITEIVAHVVETEVYDMRPRFESTLLRDPNEEWDPIDPEGWAVARDYQGREVHGEMARFVSLRRENVKWLRSLDRPDFFREHHHPKFPSIRAGDLLSSWTAHDALHARQIVKRRFQIIVRDAGKFDPGYAGQWKA